MTKLEIKQIKRYESGGFKYIISEDASIKIPKELGVQIQKGIIGHIDYEMPTEYYDVLELKTIFPLKWVPFRKRTGLGSFIISHSFSKIYNDSFSSIEISPDTQLLINTKTPELISILENREFKEGEFGYITTIQEAGEKSEQILQNRNWI